MKRAAKLWLEQFGINVISTEVVDELAIDAVTTAESLADFLRLVGAGADSPKTIGAFRFECYNDSRKASSRRVSYQIYDAAHKHKKLGWLTLHKPPATTKVYIQICNEF